MEKHFTFISGATGGIGKAFSILSAKKGYNLYLTGRSIEKLSALKQELVAINKDIIIYTFDSDLTNPDSRNAMLLDIDNKGIKFERIINVAGVDIQKAFTKYTTEKVIFQIRVNVEATISLTHELLKRRADGLEILTISSMSGVSPMPYFALYSATKCALTNFFTSLHYELKKDKIKVTTVLPGGVYTRPDIIKEIEEQGVWGKLSSKTPEYVAEKSLKALSKNKVKFIPGFFNRLLNFLMKLLPKKIVLTFIAKRWQKISKDAF